MAVADLATLALGFGVMPLAALTLYRFRDPILRGEDAAWAILAGALAFLGLAHAAATALEDVPILRLEIGAVATAALLSVGLLAGLVLGRTLLGRERGDGPALVTTLAWGGLAYLAIHSFDDGYVLGTAYAGPLPAGLALSVANVSATLVHRALEGALLVIPALRLSWKVPKSLTLLLAGLMSVPGAYAAVTIGSGTDALSFAAFWGLDLFIATLEAGLALQLLIAGYLPKLATAPGRRWTWWAGLSFLGMFLIHLVVE